MNESIHNLRAPDQVRSMETSESSTQKPLSHSTTTPPIAPHRRPLQPANRRRPPSWPPPAGASHVGAIPCGRLPGHGGGNRRAPQRAPSTHRAVIPCASFRHSRKNGNPLDAPRRGVPRRGDPLWPPAGARRGESSRDATRAIHPPRRHPRRSLSVIPVKTGTHSTRPAGASPVGAIPCGRLPGHGGGNRRATPRAPSTHRAVIPGAPFPSFP